MITKFALAAAVLASTVSTVSFAQNALKIDPAKSKITWDASKVTGKHDGTLKVKDGEVLVTGDKVTGGTFTIDMSALTVTDIKDAKMNKQLTDHLKSDDFFSVDKHPTAVFKIAKVEPAPKESADKGTHIVSGDMTIKGITKPVQFPANITVKDKQATAKATVTLDRTDWDVKYRSGKFFSDLGDKLIHDEFKVNLDLTASR